MVQRRYDKEFKRNAVELLLNSGKPLKPLARELGVSGATVYLSPTHPPCQAPELPHNKSIRKGIVASEGECI